MPFFPPSRTLQTLLLTLKSASANGLLVLQDRNNLDPGNRRIVQNAELVALALQLTKQIKPIPGKHKKISQPLYLCHVHSPVQFILFKVIRAQKYSFVEKNSRSCSTLFLPRPTKFYLEVVFIFYISQTFYILSYLRENLFFFFFKNMAS